jgi:predicted Rossmann fold nucleotide-binding protein DprA/Smf involved in DNA uptake
MEVVFDGTRNRRMGKYLVTEPEVYRPPPPVSGADDVPGLVLPRREIRALIASQPKTAHEIARALRAPLARVHRSLMDMQVRGSVEVVGYQEQLEDGPGRRPRALYGVRT